MHGQLQTINWGRSAALSKKINVVYYNCILNISTYYVNSFQQMIPKKHEQYNQGFIENTASAMKRLMAFFTHNMLVHEIHSFYGEMYPR